MEKTRLRIRFTKCGDLKWISHRDLARVWERLLRRADLQLAFSQGFHPKPRISFPSALALGIEALEEIVELEVIGEVRIEQIEADLRREMPPGMELLELKTLDYGLGKAKMIGATYRAPISPAQNVKIAGRIKELLSSNKIEIKRDTKTVTCDPRHENFELRIEQLHTAGEGANSTEQFVLIFSLPADADGSVRPLELLECVGLPDLLTEGGELQRMQVHLSEPQAGTGAA